MRKIIALCLAVLMAGCSAAPSSQTGGSAALPVTLETAAKYMDDGEYAKAIESYSAMISESAENKTDTEAMASAYVGLSEAYVKQDDAEAAAQVLADGIVRLAMIEGEQASRNRTVLKKELAEIAEENEGILPRVIYQENLEISDISCSIEPGYIESTHPDGQTVKVYSGTVSYRVNGPQDAALIASCVNTADWIEEMDLLKERFIPEEVDWYKEQKNDRPLSSVPFDSESRFDIEDTWGSTPDLCLIAVDSDLNYVGFAIIRIIRAE